VLIPGLHDHHLHIRAAAAARASVDLLDARDLSALGPGTGWLRAVNYHESIAGPLDRKRLDAVVGDRPVRVQHRTGELWMLSSAACRAVGLGDEHDGRLWRQDEWLRERVPPVELDLDGFGDELLRLGLTALTDTTPDRTAEDAAALAAALPQRLTLMAPTHVPLPAHVHRGHRKVLLDDLTLPTVEELRAVVEDSPHGIAVHCVTRVQLIVALEAGLRPGDRIEHGALIPPELIERLRDLTVVTQPNFVVEREAQYRAELDVDDQRDLYRCRSLLEAGIRVLGGTDAPYGRPDPWAAMRAAVSRDLSPQERITPEQALALFTGDGEGDWCELGVPLEVQLRELDPANVAATWIGGERVWEH
jgi:predicted amidohydrolase YtcJ